MDHLFETRSLISMFISVVWILVLVGGNAAAMASTFIPKAPCETGVVKQGCMIAVIVVPCTEDAASSSQGLGSWSRYSPRELEISYRVHCMFVIQITILARLAKGR